MNLPLPKLTLIFTAAGGTAGHTFKVAASIGSPDGTYLAEPPQFDVAIDANYRNYFFSLAFAPFQFRQTGEHVIRLLVDGQERFKTTFVVSAASRSAA